MLLYIIIFISKIILIISACPTNCEVCYNDNLCKRCKQNYILVGISQAIDNNIISCELPTILSSRVYFTTESGVYYPCSNFEYVFLENDDTECKKRDVYSIASYYSIDNKHFFPCDKGTYSIENCNECKLTSNNDGTHDFKCTSCKYGYYFKNRDYSQCFLEDDLKGDDTIFKYDSYNYINCNTVIDNCISCSSLSTCTQCNTGFCMKNKNRNKCIPISDITPVSDFYLEGNIYYSCSYGVSNCKTCNNNKEHCNECKTNYGLLDGDDTSCIHISELNRKIYYTHDSMNYYSCINYDSRHCLECEYPSSSSDFKCIKCEENYYFLDNDYTKCHYKNDITNEYYKYDKKNYVKCSSAIDGCKTCESGEKCLTCSDSDYGILDEDYTTCQEVATGINDNTIFQENNLYYSCNTITGCEKCSSRDQCTKTISDEYCIMDDGSVKKLNKTYDEYYHHAGDDLCISCDNPSFENCLLCSSEQNCIQCKENYALIDKSSCDYIITYSSNEQYFTNDGNINFYKCDNVALSSDAIEFCDKCVYGETTKKNSCIECTSNYIILDDNDNICIDITLNNIAQQINDNRIIGNDEGTKYYTCSNLMENCDTCLEMETCETCKLNYVFLNDDLTKCVLKEDLIHGHYYTTDGGVNYYSCIDNCYQCSNSDYCEVCDDGYELNDFGNKCDLILLTDEDIKNTCIFLTFNADEDDESNFSTYIEHLTNEYWMSFKYDKNYLVKYVNQELGYTILIFKEYKCSLLLYEENSFKIDTSNILTELKKYVSSKDIIQTILIYKNHTSINFFDNINNANRFELNSICSSCIQKKYKIEYNYKNKIIAELGAKYAEIIQKNNIDIFNEYSSYFQDFCQSLQFSGIDIPLNQRQYLLYKGHTYNSDNNQATGDLYACNINCTITNNNLQKFISECECDIDYDINTFLNKVNSLEEYYSENNEQNNELKNNFDFLQNSNDAFSIFTCVSTSWTTDNIKTNPGFYIVAISAIGQAVFFIALCMKVKITSFTKLLVLVNPPRKRGTKFEENKNSSNLRSKSGKNNTNNTKREVKKITDNDYYLTPVEDHKNEYNYVNKETNTVVHSENIFKVKDSESDGYSSKNSNSNEDNGETYHLRMNIMNGNKIRFNLEENKNNEYEYYPIIKFMEYDVNVYRNVGYTYEQKDIKELKKKYVGVKIIKYNLLFKNEKDKLLPIIYKPLLIDFLPFKYAVYYDKRNFCDLYKYILYLKHPIINLFINENNISRNFLPFPIKAIKIIFIGILILFFNSILITQEYLYDKYVHFDKKYNFKNMQLTDDVSYSDKVNYSMSHSAGNSFWTYIIIILFDILLTLLLSVRFRIKLLLDKYYNIDSGKNDVINKEKKEKANFEKELLNCSELKCFYIWTIVILLAFMIMFFVYLVNFCSTYKGEVPEIFFGSLWSFIFYIGFPFFTSILHAGIRIASLKSKIEVLYSISKILFEI